MITNILEYLVTDIYFQLWLIAHMKDDERFTFTKEDWDDNLITQFPNDTDIPDYISVGPGFLHHLNTEGRFHLGRNAASISISEMTIAWGKTYTNIAKNTKIDISRKVGPAKIIITNMRKWHHDGILHRRRGDSIIIKNATFIWGKMGVYGRDTGPYQISLKQVRAKSHLGDVSDFKHANISTNWSTTSGRRLGSLMIRDIIATNNIEVDLLANDSVFNDATDEVIFLTEIAE